MLNKYADPENDAYQILSYQLKLLVEDAQKSFIESRS